MSLKSVVWGLAMGLAAQAHGQSAKHVEQGDSIYFCEQEAQAKGLVKAYDPADDSAIRNYVNSAEAQGKCGRIPPNANYGFSVLFDTLHDNIVKIRLDEEFWQNPKVPEQYWIDAKQAFQQIQDNNKKAGNPASVTFTNAVPKTDSESVMRQMLRAHYMQSPMTEDQFNRFGNLSKYISIDKYSDLIIQYFLGQVTLEQLERNQETFLMEMKLSGDETGSQDNDIINGFVKKKLIKLGR